MAKTNMAVEADDKQEGGDAPLIDLNEASIKKLIAKAKRRGYITVDELNEALPQDQMSTDQIEDVMSAISEMGVNIVETDEDAQDEDGEHEEEEVAASDDEDSGDGDGEPQHVPEKKKKETTERTDDPVRMYLREMGAVELLSREGEIAIAKRVEAGRDTMILGLCESPITFDAIFAWARWARAACCRRRTSASTRSCARSSPPRSRASSSTRPRSNISSISSTASN